MVMNKSDSMVEAKAKVLEEREAEYYPSFPGFKSGLHSLTLHLSAPLSKLEFDRLFEAFHVDLKAAPNRPQRKTNNPFLYSIGDAFNNHESFNVVRRRPRRGEPFTFILRPDSRKVITTASDKDQLKKDLTQGQVEFFYKPNDGREARFYVVDNVELFEDHFRARVVSDRRHRTRNFRFDSFFAEMRSESYPVNGLFRFNLVITVNVSYDDKNLKMALIELPQSSLDNALMERG